MNKKNLLVSLAAVLVAGGVFAADEQTYTASEAYVDNKVAAEAARTDKKMSDLKQEIEDAKYLVADSIVAGTNVTVVTNEEGKVVISTSGGGGGTADSVAWGNVTGKPTTLAGYQITDAKIKNGVITLGGDTLTPITALPGATMEEAGIVQLASPSVEASAEGKAADAKATGDALEEKADKATTLSGYGITDAVSTSSNSIINGDLAAKNIYVQTSPTNFVKISTSYISRQDNEKGCEYTLPDDTGIIALTKDISTKATEILSETDKRYLPLKGGDISGDVTITGKLTVAEGAIFMTNEVANIEQTTIGATLKKYKWEDYTDYTWYWPGATDVTNSNYGATLLRIDDMDTALEGRNITAGTVTLKGDNTSVVQSDEGGNVKTTSGTELGWKWPSTTTEEDADYDKTLATIGRRVYTDEVITNDVWVCDWNGMVLGDKTVDELNGIDTWFNTNDVAYSVYVGNVEADDEYTWYIDILDDTDPENQVVIYETPTSDFIPANRDVGYIDFGYADTNDLTSTHYTITRRTTYDKVVEKKQYLAYFDEGVDAQAEIEKVQDLRNRDYVIISADQTVVAATNSQVITNYATGDNDLQNGTGSGSAYSGFIMNLKEYATLALENQGISNIAVKTVSLQQIMVRIRNYPTALKMYVYDYATGEQLMVSDSTGTADSAKRDRVFNFSSSPMLEADKQYKFVIVNADGTAVNSGIRLYDSILIPVPSYQWIDISYTPSSAPNRVFQGTITFAYEGQMGIDLMTRRQCIDLCGEVRGEMQNLADEVATKANVMDIVSQRSNGAIVRGSSIVEGQEYDTGKIDQETGAFETIVAQFGQNSLSIGNLALAAGTNSVAVFAADSEDDNITVAKGNSSMAVGKLVSAIGDNSVAIGEQTVSQGTNSHAEGLGAMAVGISSHAEGENTLAAGYAAHAEGYWATASGNCSHAEGASTEAYGQWSHAEGGATKAIGLASHADGCLAITSDSTETNGHMYAYAWQGSNGNVNTNKYYSHGDGTFNINPIPINDGADVASGFYIGELSLQDRLDARISKEEMSSQLSDIPTGNYSDIASIADRLDALIFTLKKISSPSTKTFYVLSLQDNSTVSMQAEGNAPSVSLEYSVDDGHNWAPFVVGETTVNLAKNKWARFRAGGDGNTQFGTDNLNYNHFVLSGNVEVGGNIMTLLYHDQTQANVATAFPSSRSWIFAHLFYNNSANNNALGDASRLVLPATELEQNCYSGMFSGCTSLAGAPALPAATLATSCYSGMFSGCTSLTGAPALAATNLAASCYSGMFSGCTSLTGAPALAATNLAASCYSGMFSGCTSLTDAPALPATTLAPNCYDQMFSGCTSLVLPPELPATDLAASCYSSMFYGCTSLTSAPTLCATTLVSQCYSFMFQGCSNLASIAVDFTGFSPGNATTLWLVGVAESGIFHCSSDLVIDSRSPSTVPSEWTVVADR